MKKIKTVAISLIIFLFLGGIFKDVFLDTPFLTRKKLEATLKKNGGTPETLFYRLYFLSLLPMGMLEFSIKSSSEGSVLSLEATPKNGILQNSVKASARLESYLPKDSDLPYRYVEKTKYKEKTKDKIIDFDTKNLIAIRGERKIKTPPDTYDPVSAFYKILRQKIVKGERYSVRCISEDVIYLLAAEVQDNADGLFKIHMEIKREDGTPGHGAQFFVWVAPGPEGVFLPVLFKSWTPVGYASVTFERIENKKGLP